VPSEDSLAPRPKLEKSISFEFVRVAMGVVASVHEASLATLNT
jgi:hypothetical protein